MMKLAPLETVYNGYRFRSRLEARWAVFFDTLGLRYEYEKEGFVFGDGERYLPDFWLPELRLWYEVKGEVACVERTFGGDTFYYAYPELERLERFTQSQEWPLACAVGPIGDHRIWFWGWDLTDSSGGSYECQDAEWCFSNGIFTLDVKPRRSDRVFLADDLMGEAMPQFSYARDFGCDRRAVHAAYAAARQARFEHDDYFGLRRVPTLAV